MSAVTKLFHGGIPTDVEVDRLQKEFPNPTAGNQISYSDIERVAGIKRGSGRWSSVVGAWRRKLFRKHNLLLRAISNVGFEVMNNSARVEYSSSYYRGGLRRISRATSIAASTGEEGLSKQELVARDHVVKVGASLRLAAQTAARELRLESKSS